MKIRCKIFLKSHKFWKFWKFNDKIQQKLTFWEASLKLNFYTTKKKYFLEKWTENLTKRMDLRKTDDIKKTIGHLWVKIFSSYLPKPSSTLNISIKSFTSLFTSSIAFPSRNHHRLNHSKCFVAFEYLRTKWGCSSP